MLDHPAATMAAYWDRVFLDWSRVGLGNHLWASSVTWDPEGILSTAGAIGTALLGNVAGWWLGQQRALPDRINGLFAGGALAMMGGLMWNWVFPINKSLWTSSYVLFTAGLAAVSIGTIMWMVDVQSWRRWTKPFVIYGTNPMVAFVGSGVLARCIYTLFKVEYHGQVMPLQGALYQSLFASWLSPVNASLAFALSFVLLFYVVLSFLYRRNVVFKV
jgi:predicted acyltransferase